MNIWEVSITGRKNAHVETQGTLRNFLQVFPAPSSSKISFVV